MPASTARAREYRVSLLQRGDRLRIEIRDWGVGFDPKAVPKNHFGLEGIRQRARLLGGKCSIRSKAGKGTRDHGRVAGGAEGRRGVIGHSGGGRLFTTKSHPATIIIFAVIKRFLRKIKVGRVYYIKEPWTGETKETQKPATPSKVYCGLFLWR